MQKILDALVNLLKIKSLMSLSAIAMFIFLVVNGIIDGKEAMTVITMVFTAYFVHTATKQLYENKEEDNEDKHSDLF